MNTRGLVASVGARTAIGLTALETAMLLRTGVNALGAAPLAGEEGEPVTMAFLPALDPLLAGERRAIALALPALDEALAPFASGLLSGGAAAAHAAAPKPAGWTVPAPATRLVLCLDERYGRRERGAAGASPAWIQAFRSPVETDGAARAAEVAGAIHARAREWLAGIDLEIVARGAAGAAHALPRALDALAARQVDAVVLGGVHTDYDPEVIAELVASRRLFSPANLDAAIPGEAAAFAVITRDDVARRAGLGAPLARLHAVGTGLERARPDNDEPAYVARGLTDAVRAATAEMRDAQVRAGWAITDLTFEMARHMEWQAVLVRTGAVWGPPYVVESPAQRLGRLGAAALPLAIVLAAQGWRRGFAPSSIAVAFAGSDAGERGAIALMA